jgi:hypothetical protein
LTDDLGVELVVCVEGAVAVGGAPVVAVSVVLAEDPHPAIATANETDATSTPSRRFRLPLISGQAYVIAITPDAAVAGTAAEPGGPALRSR